ncbi:MAG: HupE/UreJ family protein [Microscillaceae bacterium]|nr:HupE/UreJ family protein [Microscillaceae bacterium]
MSEFEAFFRLGFSHILNIENPSHLLDGLDHILFILVLAAVYPAAQWRKILVLVTAFTLGHSLTLVLAATQWLNFPRQTIELLIPVTIFLTAVYNFFEKPTEGTAWWTPALRVRYFLAAFFGLIHGFAFSNVLRSMFALTQESIVLKLLAFNLGIEAGQVLVVLLIMLLFWFLQSRAQLRVQLWNQVLSSVAGLTALGIFIAKSWG